jgi:hypothetical protein
MNKKIIGVLISAALLSACAGKTPSPTVPQSQCCTDTKQKPKENKNKTTNNIPKEFIR